MSKLGLQIVTALSGVRQRLRALRGEMSLRAWTIYLQETTGYETSRNSVERQENGASGLDGEYVLACMLAKGVSPAWLFYGEGEQEQGFTVPAGEPAGFVVNLSAAAEAAQARKKTG